MKEMSSSCRARGRAEQALKAAQIFDNVGVVFFDGKMECSFSRTATTAGN
jgi:hypothetical protein